MKCFNILQIKGHKKGPSTTEAFLPRYGEKGWASGGNSPRSHNVTATLGKSFHVKLEASNQAVVVSKIFNKGALGAATEGE